jgi:hypothetical protein
MSQIIAPNGSLEVTVPAAEKVAIATRGRASYSLKTDSDKVLDSANPVADFEVDNEEAVTDAVTLGGSVIIHNEGPFDCFVEVGTAPLSKDFRRETGRKGTAGALNATGTITTAMILSGAITSSTAAATNATLETGAVMDASSEWEIGESYDWGVCNTGPSLFEVFAAASGHTIVVPATLLGKVATTTNGLFRTVKTAADTFVTTRIG